MAQATVPAPSTGRATRSTTRAGAASWRWAGGFGIAHIAVMLGAFSLEGVASDSSTWAGTAKMFAGHSFNQTFYASYVEAMAFVLLVPALVILARQLGRGTEVGRVAGQTALGLGIAYVGATMAIGFPPLTTSVYAAQHGADSNVVASIDQLRNYGFILQVALLMAFTIALGAAALAGRRFTRWGGYAGIAIGTVGMVVTPFAHNQMNMVQMVWWVGLCVLCLMGGPKDRPSQAPADQRN
ncbi:MAG TPA: hypothetical protein VFQ37_14340 [Mycobacterium sp.]|nr:hypothetical protein [Mycobacterium sp.]